MAFYFSSDTNALYDTDVFPVASLPANKVEINEAVYSELLTKQNQGHVILANGSGNPYTVNQSEASATDINHAASVATTLALGHVKIGNTMTAANDGTLDLKDGAVTTAKIVDANVTADKLASNSVTTAKITDANVTADKLASDSVTTAKIADVAVTTQKIANANVTTEKIADGAVTEEKMESVKELAADETTLTMSEDANGFTFSVKDGGIDTTQIAFKAVNASKIDDDAVTNPKIADGAITTSKITNTAVTESKLADGAVTYVKIADGAIQRNKLHSSIVPNILPFTDTSDNDLQGGTWGYTWTGSFDVKTIGKIGSHYQNQFVDFTFQAEYYNLDSTGFSTMQEFKLIVWHGSGNPNSSNIYETRDVKLMNDDGPFIRERFTFETVESDLIKIGILPVNTIHAIGLKNLQLKGLAT